MTAQEPLTLPTTALYNAWASTYDTDGNVLQLLDTAAFLSRIPPLLTAPLRILELGCGTGRNTKRLAELLPPGSELVAVDASEGMVSVARVELPGVRFLVLDFIVPRALRGIDVEAVVATLVLEHVVLDEFFAAVSGVLRTGGWAWVTDMHPEMGESRAGFRGGDGVKRVGMSFAHGVKETVGAARRAGLELVGDVEERGVEVEDLERLGERAKKWVGKRMLVGFLFRKGR